MLLNSISISLYFGVSVIDSFKSIFKIKAYSPGTSCKLQYYFLHDRQGGFVFKTLTPGVGVTKPISSVPLFS